MPTVMKRLPRVFRYEGTEIPDPAPTQSVDEVKKLLSVSYPQLTNSVFEGPSIEGGKMVHTVKVAAGTKG